MTMSQRSEDEFSLLPEKQGHCSAVGNPSCYLMFIIVLFCLTYLWGYGKEGIGLDFYQFWAVGQIASTTKVDNIYSKEARIKMGNKIGKLALKYPKDYRYREVAKHRKVLETYSTPFLYTVLSIFHNSHYEIAYQTYILFCILCSISAILLLCYLLGYSWLTSMSFLAIFTFMFEPLLFDTQLGNVNQIQLMQLALFAWSRSWKTSQMRDIAGGLILGLAVMFKPNTVLVIFLLMLSWSIYRQFNQIFRTAIGIILATLIAIGSSAWFFGSFGCWIQWVKAIRNLPDDIITLSMGNFSLIMIIKNKFGSSAGLASTIALILLSFFIIWVIIHKNYIKKSNMADCFALYSDINMVGLGCILYLISAHLCWLSYYVLTIPIILTVFRTFCLNKIHSRIIPRIHCLLIISTIVLIAARPIVTLSGINRIYPYSIWSGTIILFVISLNNLMKIPDQPAV